MKFEELQVKPEIVSVLKREGIVEATTIQEKTIPLVHQGKDVIGISRTGSGKTVSFGVPMLEKIVCRGGIQGVVLAPTRELANQISGELKKWSVNLGFQVATIFGGVGMDPQIEALERSEIVVGTPGRMLDHLNRGNLNLTKVKVFVLDEADKMVEMGFIEDIEEIMGCTPRDRQILLFGATISNEIDYLKKKHMGEVVVAEAELHVKKDLLKQFYYNVKLHEKFSLLVHLLKQEEMGRVMIFCSKRSTVELVNKNLRLQGVKAEMIHGKMTQNKRLAVIGRFNDGRVNILVASAVAARGLDIKDVTHIFNYDLSQDPQEYIHRIGRTARAGEAGKAITLLAEPDYQNFDGIFARYDVDIQELPVEQFPKLRFETGFQRNFRGRNGFRKPQSFGNRSTRGPNRRFGGNFRRNNGFRSNFQGRNTRNFN